jgi:hypothetical protein
LIALPPSEKVHLFFEAVPRNKDRGGLADNLCGGETKQEFCAFVPICDGSVKGFTNDGIMGRLNNGG